MITEHPIPSIHLWKVQHLVKGALSFIGPLNKWRMDRASTGGTNLPAYCFRAWHRALRRLASCGFSPQGASMAELGPGDTIGTGLAALLSGVQRYAGMDVVPFARDFDAATFFDRLTEIASAAPEASERPAISTEERLRIRADLSLGMTESETVRYVVPWSESSAAAASLDLVMSVGCLQAVDRLEDVCRIMYRWLRPGGYSYHWIPCFAQYLSPFWNGHWAYSALEWRVVRGRRLYLLNRYPISHYLSLAENAGFEVLLVEPLEGKGGLPQDELVEPFRSFDAFDSRTRGAHVVLRRPFSAPLD